MKSRDGGPVKGLPNEGKREMGGKVEVAEAVQGTHGIR